MAREAKKACHSQPYQLRDVPIYQLLHRSESLCLRGKRMRFSMLPFSFFRGFMLVALLLHPRFLEAVSRRHMADIFRRGWPG